MARFHLPQYDNELFYRYFNRIYAYDTHSRYSYQTWELCHVIYNGMNNETWEIVHSLSEGGFCETNYEYNWELFEYLAHDTRQWELNNQQNSSFVSPCEHLDVQESFSKSTEDMIRSLTIKVNALHNHCKPLNDQESFCISTEDLVRSLASSVGALATNVNNLTNTLSNQQSTISNLETQMGEMTSTIMSLESQNELDCYVDESQNECASKFENPSPLELNVGHSFDYYYDEDDDEDTFDIEECGHDLNCSLPSQLVCMSIDSPCTNINIPHIDNDFSKGSKSSDDLTLEVLLSVMVEDKQERMTFEKEEVVLEMVEQIDKCSPNDTPSISQLGDSLVSIPKVSYTFFFSYPISTKPDPSYKEPYRDIESIFENSGPKNCLLYACASIVHVWFYLILIHYNHFSSLYASIFDRLLRALSCSALDSSCC